MPSHSRHGDFEIIRQETAAIIMIRSVGAWNHQTYLAFSACMQDHVAQMQHRPFAILTDIEHWELAPPDCQPVIDALVNYEQAGGCQLRIMFETGIPQAILTRMLQHAQSDPRTLNLHIARDIPHAEAILNKAGFTLNRTGAHQFFNR